jgi:sodium/hydrogen exchanger-like protein 6/7
VGSCLFLGSVLYATDEVSAMSFIRMKDFPQLGALIFGEGVLNDSLSIVLFKSLHDETSDANSYLSSSQSTIALDSALVEFARILWKVLFQLIFSSLTGIGCGLACAMFFKLMSSTRSHPIHQTSLVLLFGMLAYSIAGTSFLIIFGCCSLFMLCPVAV